MSTPLATVGILSIGQMGLGIAQLLIAHKYRVLTNLATRSSATQIRAKTAQISLVETDTELVAQSDYILSIVPPRDAIETARRIVDAFAANPRSSSAPPLYYLDLNAIAPSTTREIAKALEQYAPDIRFVDGGIIGGPPTPTIDSTWKCPSIPLSGPFPLQEATRSGEHLALTLNSRYLGPRIGSASGLKCCFAALSKGMTALFIQSFSTAAALDVLPALQKYLQEYNPGAAERAEKSVTGCPSKAYRWVEEMHQIGVCFSEDGGWKEQAKVFREVAGVFDELASAVEERGGTEGLESADAVVEALREGKGKGELR